MSMGRSIARRGWGNGGSRRLGSRAILFTFDALLASLLILAALLLVLHLYPRAPPVTQTTHYAQDALLALNAMPVGDLEDPWIQAMIGNGTIQDPEASVLQQIGTFWAVGESAAAENLSRLLLDDLLPQGIGFRLALGGQEILAVNGSASPAQRTVARRMIAGIQQNASLEGSTSVAYLKRIRDKKSFVVSYFGGFVGQGNLTVETGPVPDDVTSDRITAISLRLDTVEDFSVGVNGAPCATIASDGQLLDVQEWDLTSCNGSFVPGMNNVTFTMLGDLADAYLAGGYLKVEYLTDEFVEEETNGSKRYAFPAIDGVINLYDSVYAPGVVTDWRLNLSFWSNYTVYLRLGNETIFSSPGSNATQQVLLEAHNLSWAPTTIPLRLGTTNFTNVTIPLAGQPGDTAIVTDVSGSMGECGEEYTGQVCTYDCCIWVWSGWWCPSWTDQTCPLLTGSCSNEVCGDCGSGWTDRNYLEYYGTICNRTKLKIAQAADKTAVGIILNHTGNRVGLVSYNNQVRDTMDLTTDEAALTSQIDGYTANSGTCICCGINRAKNMVKDSPNKRFMIVMSDGDANYACSDFDDYYGTYNEAEAPQDTIDAGQNACVNHNITVFTIGFGSGMSAQGKATLQQAACNSSLYYDAENVSQLEEIYRNISKEINLQANFTAQTLVINGTYIVSHLYAGGYLDLNYIPIIDPPRQGEILVKVESPQFANCTASVEIPPGLRVTDALSTSYSGPYWTAYLAVNGIQAFNLSDYVDLYVNLGDPFLVAIPPTLLNTSNSLQLLIENNDRNATNCSANNSVIYSGLINASVPRSEVLAKAEGCRWTIEFEDDHFLNVTIPSSYTGNKSCTYTNASHDASGHDDEDAYDYGVFHLLQKLDFDDDGRVFVNLEAADLEIIVTVVSKVPYLWGPAFVTLEAWR